MVAGIAGVGMVSVGKALKHYTSGTGDFPIHNLSSLCAVIYIKEGCSKMSKIIGARRPFCSPRTTIAALPATYMHAYGKMVYACPRPSQTGGRASIDVYNPSAAQHPFFFSHSKTQSTGH